MNNYGLKLPSFALGLLLATSSLAAVTVRFNDPEKFTDLSMTGSQTKETQEILLRGLEGYFKELAVRHLPKSDSLEIIVLNVDMAGAFERWHVPYMYNARVVRDLYPPRFTLHYRWLDKSGALLADQEETLVEPNFLILNNYLGYSPNDPLRYEKGLLARWFDNRFAQR